MLWKQWKQVLIFTCGNDTIKTATMNKIPHLFAFFFYYLSPSFNFKIFLQIQNTNWIPSILYKLVTTDLVYKFYNFVELKVLANIFLNGPTLSKYVQAMVKK